MSGGRPKKLPPGCKWKDLKSGRVIDMYLSMGTDPATGKRLSRHTRAATVEEAWRIYEETRDAVRAGTPRRSSTVTVDAYLGEWLDGRRSIRPTTLAGYRTALLPLRAEFGELPLRRLTKAHLDKLITAVETGKRGPLETDPARRELPMLRGGKEGGAKAHPMRPWKPRTVQLFVVVLAKALDEAVRAGLADKNVAREVELRRVPQFEPKTWTPKQVLAAVTKLREDRDEIAFLLAMHGLRRGEVCGMAWGPGGLDIDAGTVTIADTRVLVAGAVQDGPPKSRRSERTLPLTPILAAAARRARSQQSADRLALGAAYTDSGLVVRTITGEGPNPDNLSGAWERFCSSAGLPVIRLHDARHTIATLLAQTGTPPSLLSAWVGHASNAFTMQTYVHDQDDALGSVADSINRLLGGELGDP